MRKEKWMRKGRRVLAQFRTGTIVKAFTYELEKQRFVYLFLVKVDDEEKPIKFHPNDVEELTKEKL